MLALYSARWGAELLLYQRAEIFTHRYRHITDILVLLIFLSVCILL